MPDVFSGDVTQSSLYRRSFEVRRDAIHKILYNDRLGMWFDYDYVREKQRKAYYISNFTPLFAQCYHRSDDKDKNKDFFNKVWFYINVSLIIPSLECGFVHCVFSCSVPFMT